MFSKRGSVSHEQLQKHADGDTVTPRLIEPRGDNADLRMISENRDTEGNEFGSKIVQQNHGSDAERRIIDLNVGPIEMKLTHHSVNSASRFKRRLKSAGPRRFHRGMVSGANNSLCEGQIRSLIRTNASGTNIMQQTLTLQAAAARQSNETLARMASDEYRIKEAGLKDETGSKHRFVKMKQPNSDTSWVQQIDLNKEESKSHTRTYKQVNTLMLSEKSHVTGKNDPTADKEGSGKLDVHMISELVASPPSVGQLHQPGSQSSMPVIRQTSQNSGTEPQVDPAVLEKERLQQLIEEEILKIKETMAGERGHTP